MTAIFDLQGCTAGALAGGDDLRDTSGQEASGRQESHGHVPANLTASADPLDRS